MTNQPPDALSIFVSHSHADNTFGLRLVQDLRAALGSVEGVWYDASEGLQGGDAWWSTIRRELRERPVFLVILSPDAVASPWVNSEIDLAWKQHNSPSGKIIIPVVYRPCAVREDLDTLPAISFVEPRRYEEAFEQLLAALRQPLAPARVKGGRNVAGSSPSGAASMGPRRGLARHMRTLAFAGLAVLVAALALSQLLALRSDGGRSSAQTAATQTAVAFAASETALASTTPTLTPSETLAYTTNTPGPCDHRALWTFNGRTGITSFACGPGGTQLTTKNVNSENGPGGLIYEGHGGVFPAKYRVSERVVGLSSSGCPEIDLDYANGDNSDFYSVWVCADGRWMAQYSGTNFAPEEVLGQGTVAPLGSDVELSLTFTGAGIAVTLGSTSLAVNAETQPPPHMSLSSVWLTLGANLDTTASVALTDFQFTPLS